MELSSSHEKYRVVYLFMHSKWGNKQVKEREVRQHAPINTLRYRDTGVIEG